MGSHSVHTSAEALREAEARISAIQAPHGQNIRMRISANVALSPFESRNPASAGEEQTAHGYFEDQATKHCQESKPYAFASALEVRCLCGNLMLVTERDT